METIEGVIKIMAEILSVKDLQERFWWLGHIFVNPDEVTVFIESEDIFREIAAALDLPIEDVKERNMLYCRLGPIEFAAERRKEDE